MTFTTEQRTCDKHGQYTSYAFPRDNWTGCPECSRILTLQRQQEAERQYREASELERRNRFLATSGLLGRQAAARFDTYVTTSAAQRDVLEACRAFAGTFPDARTTGAGMFLIGPPGTGKTHLASAMVGDLIRRAGQPAKLLTPRDIIRRLRATWRKDATESEDEALQDLATDALLVIDEAGTGFGTEADRLQIEEAVNERYRRELPTLVTSNLSLPQLRQALGERAFDRLREGARVLVLDWPSHRGPAL